jgi:hypothetical protein
MAAVAAAAELATVAAAAAVVVDWAADWVAATAVVERDTRRRRI